MIGRGIVGGYVWTQEGVAAKLADTTMRVVNGTRPKDIPVEIGPDVPMFDWRQLQRWGIGEERLPPGSIIRFRDPTLWQQYKWHIAGIITVVVLQAVLIGALLVQRKRAQKARRVLQESEERFRNMADTTPTMIWILGPDQQCTFVNRAWLTFTGRRYAERATLLDLIRTIGIVSPERALRPLRKWLLSRWSIAFVAPMGSMGLCSAPACRAFRRTRSSLDI